MATYFEKQRRLIELVTKAEQSYERALRLAEFAGQKVTGPAQVLHFVRRRRHRRRNPVCGNDFNDVIIPRVVGVSKVTTSKTRSAARMRTTSRARLVRSI